MIYINPYRYRQDWSPASLFVAGEDGAQYHLYDATTLNTVYDQSGAQPTDGDPVGWMEDQSGNGNHATQSTSAARPTYDPAGLEMDKVDDNFVIPIGSGFTGDFALILSTGPIFGSIDTKTDGQWQYTKTAAYIPEGKVYALIVVDRALTATEKSNIISYYSAGVTTNPTAAERAFRSRTDLTALDLSETDYSQVTNAMGAFDGCSSLTTPPDVSGWTQVTDASYAFRNCSSLTTPSDVSGWTQVANAGNTFQNCSSLTTPPDVSGWTQVTNAGYTFQNCNNLTTPPDVSGWTPGTNAGYTFSNCSSLTTPPDVSGWTQITNALAAFQNCSSLTTPPDVSGWTQVTAAGYTFINCSSLTTPPDVSGWTQVTNANSAFRNCSSLTTPPDVSGWTQVTAAPYAFYLCNNLTTPPDVSGWTQITDANSAFRNCSSLTSAVDISGWNPTILTDGTLMMSGISAAGFDQTAYDAALIAWDIAYDLTTVNTLSIHFGSAQYTSGGAAETARTTLDNNGWTITDGGAA